MSVFVCSSTSGPSADGAARRSCTSSAPMATAISAVVTAPIFSPMGACTRASRSAGKPSAVSCSISMATRRLEPIIPT